MARFGDGARLEDMLPAAHGAQGPF
jgi:hypothetical protein